MNNMARIYRDEILRAVLGPGAHAAQAIDLPRLHQFVERLVECDVAHAILHLKCRSSYGMSLSEIARSVPCNEHPS